MITAVRIFAGIWGFILNEGRGRSTATKAIEKASIYYFIAVFFSSIVGLLMATNSTLRARPGNEYGPVWATWFVFGASVTMAAFHAAYRARHYRLQLEKQIEKTIQEAERAERERMRGDLFAEKLAGFTPRQAHKEPEPEQETAPYIFEEGGQIEIDGDGRRYIEFGHEEQGTAAQWAAWLKDSKASPKTKAHATKLRRIADSMTGPEWRPIVLTLMNFEKTAR
jgi:hypothetical protein